LNQNSNTSWLYQSWLIKQKATDMLFEPVIATAAFCGLIGFLVGYFIRKIVKVIFVVNRQQYNSKTRDK
jgi:hypothetical protein